MPKDTRPRKATHLPENRELRADDTANDYRTFIGASKKFMNFHGSVQIQDIPLQLIPFAHPPVVNQPEYYTDEWKKMMFSSLVKIDSDTIFRDNQGHLFLFYVRNSLSSQQIAKLTEATYNFCSAVQPVQKKDESSRYELPEHTATTRSGTYDFTSVELGHGFRGILFSSEIVGRNTAEAFAQYGHFSEKTVPAMNAMSMMYYHLADISRAVSSVSGTNIHQDLIDLSKKTFELSDPLVRGLLGRPWIPFSQRRLICNLNSVPHVDKTNDTYSLNGLTFYGTAQLWLLVVVAGQSYCFKVSQGASILFPASLFLHCTLGWGSGDRFVLSCWTSSSLGYRQIIQGAHS